MKLRRIDEDLWELPAEGGMKVPGRIYAAGPPAPDDPSLQQVANVAHLPGILRFSLAMPDYHWGYGFPIGGVAAVDPEIGAISPGGVGYDINCGVRVVTTALHEEELRPRLRQVVAQLFRDVPTGVGASRAIPALADDELDGVLAGGARWAAARGFAAAPDDPSRCEEGGRLPQADPAAVSDRARARGRDQLGTLGSGNHFLELDRVAEIYAPDAAAAFGLLPGAVAIQIHSGSRGLGYQVCDESLAALTPRMRDFGPDYAALPDPQLACAPVRSDAGRRYLAAMQAAANFAFANRQVMTGLAVRALCRSLGLSEGELGARVLYDVCHNVAKLETHAVDGAPREVLVHRKGATRAFGPGDPRVPAPYRAVGQPVLIPGDMGRYSYVLAGTDRAMRDTFGSSCHGAGRLLSRGQALKLARGRSIDRELAARGIEVLSRGRKTLGEEMSEAYKDVAQVVAVMHRAGLSRLVARLEPLGVIKG
ncbi:RtcB family protein [Anaeromyxobacter paludicola]|uniref:tRNA-splicing ligase RtcB n=1 Tax=Anaeromyxobacter paludicola TaxID=2918171 RepID=A0ABM7X990_9BACT|nr:RtcB family protein [Anaeromyxobacter paludicola]BDG08418.1 RNA-splicing ligase RtcB [Anaeromyxobacter paludicola]